MTGADETTAPPVEPTRRWRTPIPVDAGVPERRPSDVAVLAIAVVGVVLTGLWAQTSSDIDTNLFSVVNGLPNAFEGLAHALAFLGSLWWIAIVVAALLLARWFPTARDVALAGVGAWGLAWGLDQLLGTRAAASVGVVVRTGSGPAFPVPSVAAYVALAVALAPYVVRPLRLLLLVIAPFVALAAMYLGTGFPSDVIGGVWLGLAAGALVHVAFGAPGGRPSPAQITAALTELGLDPVTVDPVTVDASRATIMDAQLAAGTRARVVAYGRDQRDGQVATRLWHAVMYRAPGVPVFGSRLQEVEHGGYALLVAGQAGVNVPRLVRTGIAGPDAALLVTEAPEGRPLDELDDDLDDVRLAAAWTELAALHAAGIAHGDLGADRLLLRDDGSVAFSDLGDAQLGTLQYWRDGDVAALLATTAALVGNDRAIGAAVATLGAAPVGAAIPLLQPAALPRRTGRDVEHFAKVLKQLRTEVAAATGVEDVAPLKVKRLSLVNIGMLAGILLALADRDPQPRERRLAHRAAGVRARDLGLGGARTRALADHPHGVGDRAARLRRDRPALRAHRAHAGGVQLPQPDHAERHRRHRAAARLPAPPGRAGRFGCERDGALDRRGRRDPGGAVPDRGVDHGHDGGLLELRGQRLARRDRHRRGARRGRALDPQGPVEGRSRGQAGGR